MRIHAVAAVLVIIAGAYFNVTKTEWAILVVCIGSVFSAELFNTAAEHLTDIVSPGMNNKAGIVKDIAAGAVLVMAFTSLIIAAIIFIPRLIIQL